MKRTSALATMVIQLIAGGPDAFPQQALPFVKTRSEKASGLRSNKRVLGELVKDGPVHVPPAAPPPGRFSEIVVCRTRVNCGVNVRATRETKPHLAEQVAHALY